MMDPAFKQALAELTEIQRQAVDWQEGSLLVLAGPGSGKTQVLTCRIARLLDDGREKNFRVLALTFTNKAADEMKARVARFVPGLEDRANIGTFHSFCGQILRQHGVHIGIKPDFAIYALDADRLAVLQGALIEAKARAIDVSVDDVRLLPTIDRLKARLIDPANALKALSQSNNAQRVALVYEIYEGELRKLNALDFNSLIFEAYKLATTFPALASRYRVSHPFWMLDEFQDTNSAQYRFIRALAGSDFRNIFAVADDDQIIYQWNGASFRHIQALRADYSSELIQLPTNYRCPPIIVETANKLVAYNAQRSSEKVPLIAAKTSLKLPEGQHMLVREYETDEEEAASIAAEIQGLGKDQWGSLAVLGRNRSLLDKMHAALKTQNVPSQIAQRRDDFLSPELRWLVAALTQIVRPLDKRNLGVLIEAYNRIGQIGLSPDQVVVDAEASGHSYAATWVEAVEKCLPHPPYAQLLKDFGLASSNVSAAKGLLDKAPDEFSKTLADGNAHSDLDEDIQAWKEIRRDIGGHIGRNAPMDQFLQELQLRSKEPAPKPNTVALMTVHAAKGREFDFVFLVGLAEDVMPSFQSLQKGEKSPEMEEERRNCFVAITRTKECLVLSRAKRYRGWNKQPSRFLVEMGLVN